MDKKPVWVLVDKGKRGTESQCLGITQALKIFPKVFHLSPQNAFLFYMFPVYFFPKFIFKFLFPNIPFSPPFVIIGGGRVAVKVTAILKTYFSETIAIVVQKPQQPLSAFDMVIAPQHDRVRGDNVIETIGAPNILTQEGLLKGKEELNLSPQSPSPFVMVIVGGSTKYYKLNPDVLDKLAKDLWILHQKYGGTYLITLSRRTGLKNSKALETSLKKYFKPCESNPPYILWDGTSGTPENLSYQGMLGIADHVIVTEDSVSMISEACFTGKPVYIYSLPPKFPRGIFNHKFKNFHNYLLRANMILRFNGLLATCDYTPLQESQRISTLLRAKFKI